jgi:hypothetical protein
MLGVPGLIQSLYQIYKYAWPIRRHGGNMLGQSEGMADVVRSHDVDFSLGSLDVYPTIKHMRARDDTSRSCA